MESVDKETVGGVDKEKVESVDEEEVGGVEVEESVDYEELGAVDSCHIPEVDFCPLRPVGPLVPLSEVNALSLFELFFDEGVMDRILRCTNAYAEHKKEEKKKRYALFMKRKLTKEELKAFIGALLLLGIHGCQEPPKGME